MLHKRNHHHETGHACLCLSLLRINHHFFLLRSRRRETFQPRWQFSTKPEVRGLYPHPSLTSTVNACVGTGLLLNNWTSPSPPPHSLLSLEAHSPSKESFCCAEMGVTARIRKANASCFVLQGELGQANYQPAASCPHAAQTTAPAPLS